MTAFDEEVLMAALENEVTSWQMLHDPQVVGSLTSKEFYELCLRAGYGEKASMQAARDRAWARMEKNLDK